MNKKAVFFTFLIIAGVAAFFIYQKESNKVPPTLWDYVSDDALAVVELQGYANYAELTPEGFISQLITQTSDTSIYHFISRLGLLETLGSQDLLVSLHITSNQQFGFTFFLKNDARRTQEVILKIIEAFTSTKGTTHTVRSYNGKEIHEGKFKGMPYSYIIEDNVIVFSSYSFLIEDAIRMTEDDTSNGFAKSNADIMQMPKLTNDQGNLYLNVRQINKLMQLFVKPSILTPLQNSLAKNAFLDVTLTDAKLDLSGFTQADNSDLLNTFKQQSPVKDRFNYYIPNNTSTASKYLISDAVLWLKNLKVFWSNVDPGYLNDRNDFASKYGINPDEFFAVVSDGLCELSFNDGPEPEQLLFISTSDVSQGLQLLNSLSERVARLNGDSVYVEQYGNYFITELNIENFSTLTYGPQFSGFNTTYFVSLNDMIVLGNTVEVIKNFLSSMENEATWSRSKAYNTFYDAGLEEINYSYAYNLQRLWPKLLNTLNIFWNEHATQHADLLRGLKYGMVQFSRIDNSYYTNLSLQYQKQAFTKERKYYVPEFELSFNSPLITKPYVVKNHNTKLFEVIFQDASNNIILTSNDGKNLWSKAIDSPITAPVNQIDFYKNGKLQYFFTSNKKLHILDRLGNYIDDYPLEVDFTIADASIIDYDKSKNYRFLLTDVQGNIYLLDKYGKLLDGWSPYQVGARLSDTPFHLRIRARDCFVFLTQNGILNVLNRRGERLPNFPVELEDRYESAIFVEKGANLSDTKLHLLSKPGRLTKVNLNGDILSSEELYKQTKEAEFKIIPDALGKTYIIVRREKNRLVILNSSKEEILSKDYLGAGKLDIQYYYFTPENEIYAVTDIEQGFTYLYRSNGDLINAQPMSSDKEIAILYSENRNEYTVFKIHEDNFSMLKF